MKCIIIKNDGIGDFILATGIIKSLMNHFSTIDLVTCIENKEIVDMFDPFNKVFYVSRDSLSHENNTIPAFDKYVLEDISIEEYDVAIVLRRFIRSSTFVIMDSIVAKRKVLCWQYPTNLEYADALKLSETWEHYEGNVKTLHESLYYKIFLEKIFNINISIEPSLRIKRLDKKKRNTISICLDGRGWVIHSCEEEEKHKWVNLINKLVNEGFEIYLLGKSYYAQKLAKIIELINIKVFNYVDRISLVETIGLLNKSEFYIGNDTGISHLAGIYSGEVFVIHGGGGLSRFFPWPNSSNQKIISAELECFDCCWICHKESYECITEVDYTDVYGFFIKNIRNLKFVYTNMSNTDYQFSIDSKELNINTVKTKNLIKSAVNCTIKGINMKNEDINNEDTIDIEQYEQYLKALKEDVSYDEKIAYLKKTSSTLIDFEFIEDQPKRNLQNVISKFKDLSKTENFSFSIENVDLDKFKEYFYEINYKENYSRYCEQYKRSLSRKMMEHYLSFEILSIEKQNKNTYTFMDVACSTSPVQLILKNNYEMQEVYKQDLNSQLGVHDKYKIVCNAIDIPLQDKLFDGITLHNSWEHFEGLDDIGFITEASRLLKKGGKFIILPLDLADETYILTSPTVWFNKYRNLKGIPKFDNNAKIFINENKSQRQEKCYSVEYIVEIINQFSSDFEFEIIYFENISIDNKLFSDKYKDLAVGAEDHFAEFVLVGTRK